MILDLRELKRSGKDSQSYYFEYNPESELCNIPDAKVDLPIKVSGEIFLTGEHQAVVSGEIVFSIEGECTRCLEPTKKEFVVEFDEEVGEDCTYEVVNDRIDLKKIVDDTVIMNIPITFLCKEDCKGICSGCGVNLNYAECKCEK